MSQTVGSRREKESGGRKRVKARHRLAVPLSCDFDKFSLSAADPKGDPCF
jgi:hypothetical protein